VQIIFAGKSHPADDIGKHHLQRVYKRALDPLFGGASRSSTTTILHVAHFLVAGLRRVAEQPAQAARGERHRAA
jgi:starch phosphorylase